MLPRTCVLAWSGVACFCCDCVCVAAPEGVWWAETSQTHKTLSHNVTEWSSLSCPENIPNSTAWPAPLQTAPDRQRHRLNWAVYTDVCLSFYPGVSQWWPHHFLRVPHQLDFTEGRIDFLHAVTLPPAPDVHRVLQRSREQAAIQTPLWDFKPGIIRDYYKDFFILY